MTELLIVIAIIGILAAIAIPMYKTQTVKAKLTEVSNAMSNVASATAAYIQEGSGWPTAGDIPTIGSSLGVSLGALTRISAMSVTTGVISATVSNIDVVVNGSNLTLTPSSNPNDTSIIWSWSSTDMPAAYMPKR